MEIIDLRPEHHALFARCLEDWSDEAEEGAPRREAWIAKMLDRGLRAKLAADDGGRIGGMIQYAPIEHAMADGHGLYFVHCVWVHGHKQGRGNFQHRGMGRALLAAAEDDARAHGAQGMAAWGLWLPFWMRASWFKKHGYAKADRQGMAVLLWKPFDREAQPPKWYPPARRPLPATPGKVNVVSFTNGWCMAQNVIRERAGRAAAEFGDAVAFHEIDTFTPAATAEWGRSDGLFIDGKEVRSGPPPKYETIRRLIEKRVKKS